MVSISSSEQRIDIKTATLVDKKKTEQKSIFYLHFVVVGGGALIRKKNSRCQGSFSNDLSDVFCSTCVDENVDIF